MANKLDVLRQLLNWLLSLFAKTTLPYPEEGIRPEQTLANTSFILVMQEWFYNYKVPAKYYPFWRDAIVCEVTDQIAYPAQTWEVEGLRHLAVRPEWLNPGVLSHEFSHCSYALLTSEEKIEFANVYNGIKVSNRLVKLLYETKWPQWAGVPGVSEEVEMHAEIFRFVGWKMPQSLWRFYPKLVEEV